MIVRSKSASGKTIPGFLASKPKTNLNLFYLDVDLRATAEEECPIKAKTSILPVFIMGEAIFLPLQIKYSQLLEESFLQRLLKWVINKTPCLAGLKTAVFPIMMAGISRQNVSFKG